MRHSTILLRVEDYDLAATLCSGQAFRWQSQGATWHGLIGPRWVRLTRHPEGILAESSEGTVDWGWLEHYLQTQVDLSAIQQTFPQDEAMQASLAACRGLRLLRQDPWECLASFILSSTKQIVQIRQIIGLLCQRFGSPVAAPSGFLHGHTFPTASALATLSEAALRDCKMGFRAPYLRKVAQAVAEGRLDLEELGRLDMAEARARLTELPGIGDKIANCVLLFAYGFPQAFPIDVWIMKGLRGLYFPKRRPTPRRLLRFVDEHFGPHSGYAQQYLFHYLRTVHPPLGRK